MSKQITEAIAEAKQRVKESISKDKLIMFITRLLEDTRNDSETDLFGRVIELYYYLNPYKKAFRREIYVYFQKEIKCKEGLILDEEEINYLRIIFKEITPQFRFKDGKVMKGRLKGILDKLVKKYLPHSSEIINSFILSKLICSVGGIENLMRKPASTIQLIGCEKALFRHNRSGNDCPKYGLLYYTKELQEATKKGKKARQLSNTLAITIKQDYFENFAR